MLSLDVLLASLVMAIVVLFTRSIGYLVGSHFRGLHRYKDVLEALPGCAMMSLIFPALLQANPTEITALIATAALMWVSNNVALATICGLLILIVANA